MSHLSLNPRWAEKKMDSSASYELVQADQLTMTAGTYNYPGKGSPYDEASPEKGGAGR